MEVTIMVEHHLFISDGLMWTLLIASALKGGESAEKWNIDHPDIIKEIHQAYFDAGADVATTNTFGATSFKLEKMGIKESVETINLAAIKNARTAAGPGHYIAGDLGPLGEMLVPVGSMTFDRAKKIYGHQAEVMEAAGVDLFIIQTFFDLTEAIAALEAVRAVSSKPVFCTLTFNQTKRGFFTLVGNSVAESMKKLRGAGAAAVGANCSIGSDTMIALAREIRGSVEIPVIIQPNAGLPQTTTDGTVFYPEDEAFFTESIQKIKALGIEIVGGCCGTTPAIIRKVRESI